MRRNTTLSPAWRYDAFICLCTSSIYLWGDCLLFRFRDTSNIQHFINSLPHIFSQKTMYTILANHNYLSKLIKCSCTVRLISLPLYSISRTYDNDNDQCYFNTAQRPGCQGHFFIRKEDYWLLTRDWIEMKKLISRLPNYQLPAKT